MHLKPDKSQDAALAELLLAGLASNALTAVRLSGASFGDLSLTECLKVLESAVERVRRGEVGRTERES